MKLCKHIMIVAGALLVFLGIPTVVCVDIPALFTPTSVGVVTRASMELPEQPSGEFVVLFHAARYPDTSEQWQTFFSGGDAGVILSDLTCLVAESDAGGIQLAERFQARLPENQMQVKHENGLLVISKAQCGLFDVIVLSKEMADAYQLQTVLGQDGYIAITVKGE